MADLSALEELLLGGYDVGALLAAQASAGQGPGALLGLGGGLKPPLTQSGLGWAGPAPTDQSSIYQVRQKGSSGVGTSLRGFVREARSCSGFKASRCSERVLRSWFYRIGG